MGAKRQTGKKKTVRKKPAKAASKAKKKAAKTKQVKKGKSVSKAKAVKAKPAGAKPAKKASSKVAAKALKKAPKKPAKSATAAKPAKAAPITKKPPSMKPRRRGDRTAARPAAPRRRSPREIARYRELLVDKHRDLLHAYTNAKGDSLDRQADGTEDYIDYAVSSYDREFLLSLTELDQKQLRLVDEALKRIERPREFGFCLQCGQQIPDKRLEVQPWARYCVRCQELDEQGLLLDDPLDQDEDDDGPADQDAELGVDEGEEEAEEELV